MAFKLAIENMHKPSIDLRIQKLALEANVLNNLLDNFRSLVPDLLSKITDISVSLTNSDAEINSSYINEITKSNISLSNKIKHSSFVTYSKTLVSVPEGFSGNFVDYLSFLNSIHNEIYTTGYEMLNEYNLILSSFITNKEDKISNKDYSVLFNKIKTNREHFINQIKKYFNESDKSKLFLKDVLRNFRETEELIVEIRKLDKDHNKQNIKQLSSLVNKTSDLLTIIINDLDKNGTNKISGMSAKNIANGAYEIAKYIEFVSIFRFKTEQSIVSVVKLFKQLDEIINI